MTDPRRHSWHPIDLTKLEPKPAQRPTMQHNLLYPGLRHLLSGEPEAGKSWLALATCVEQIRAGHHAVWIDREADPDFMLERLTSFGVTPDELARFIYLNPHEPITQRGVTDTIAQLLDAYAPTLVVADALAGLLELHDLDENKTGDVERGFRLAVEPWRTTGAATLTIDHVGRNRENRGRYAIGSQRKLGVVDVHIGLEVVAAFGRGRSGKAKVFVHKDRSGFLQRPRFGDFILDSDENGAIRSCAIVDAPAAFQPTFLMEKVSSYLLAEGERSRNQIEKDIDRKAEFVRKAIDELVATGYIAEREGPRGARLYRHVLLYKAPEDGAASDPQPEQKDEQASFSHDDIPW